MAPLVILLVTFALGFVINRYLLDERFYLSEIGRFAMAMMLVATGIAHFTSTELMISMLPEVVPFKREMVLFTGVCEIAAAVGLLWKRTFRFTGIVLIVFFVLILPANIIGSLKEVEFGGMENGARYLFFRIPLQILFIGWVWYFAVRESE